MAMKNPIVELEGVDVLEFSERPYTNKKGEATVFRDCLIRYQGKVLKLSVSKDCPVLPVATGKTLQVELVTWGDDLSPKFSVLAIVGK